MWLKKCVEIFPLICIDEGNSMWGEGGFWEGGRGVGGRFLYVFLRIFSLEIHLKEKLFRCFMEILGKFLWRRKTFFFLRKGKLWRGKKIPPTLLKLSALKSPKGLTVFSLFIYEMMCVLHHIQKFLNRTPMGFNSSLSMIGGRPSIQRGGNGVSNFWVFCSHFTFYVEKYLNTTHMCSIYWAKQFWYHAWDLKFFFETPEVRSSPMMDKSEFWNLIHFHERKR